MGLSREITPKDLQRALERQIEHNMDRLNASQDNHDTKIYLMGIGDGLSIALRFVNDLVNKRKVEFVDEADKRD